jgi:hypothetical protein
MPSRAARSLLTGLIDYAGLFPPAKLPMQQAAEAFARARMSEEEWMLARFVCPASRLEELSKAASVLMPGTNATSGYREHLGEPWRITCLIDLDLDPALDRIADFSARHAAEENGLAKVDMAELKVTDPHAIDEALDVLPASLYPFFEFPITGDCRGYVAALAGNSSAAKVRTGGITPDAFPSPADIAAFLAACAAADVPFKATAGLHHAIRGPHRLTYEPTSPSCTMHGFLNLFLAAALARVHKLDSKLVTALLSSEDPRLFAFDNDHVQVRVPGARPLTLDSTQIAHVREGFALSFGSCSFEEPVQELTKLGIL